jgi:hypothetical protein
LRGVKLDRHWRVREADLQAFLAARLVAWAVDEEERQASLWPEGAGDEVPTPLASEGAEEVRHEPRSGEVAGEREEPPTVAPSVDVEEEREEPPAVAPIPAVVRPRDEPTPEAGKPPRRGKPRRVAPKPTVERETPQSVALIPEASVPRRRVGTWGRG